MPEYMCIRLRPPGHRSDVPDIQFWMFGMFMLSVAPVAFALFQKTLQICAVLTFSQKSTARAANAERSVKPDCTVARAKKAGIATIDKAVLSHALSFLDLKSLLSVQHVNWHWHEAGGADYLWNALSHGLVSTVTATLPSPEAVEAAGHTAEMREQIQELREQIAVMRALSHALVVEDTRAADRASSKRHASVASVSTPSSIGTVSAARDSKVPSSDPVSTPVSCTADSTTPVRRGKSAFVSNYVLVRASQRFSSDRFTARAVQTAQNTLQQWQWRRIVRWSGEVQLLLLFLMDSDMRAAIFRMGHLWFTILGLLVLLGALISLVFALITSYPPSWLWTLRMLGLYLVLDLLLFALPKTVPAYHLLLELLVPNSMRSANTPLAASAANSLLARWWTEFVAIDRLRAALHVLSSELAALYSIMLMASPIFTCITLIDAIWPAVVTVRAAPLPMAGAGVVQRVWQRFRQFCHHIDRSWLIQCCVNIVVWLVMLYWHDAVRDLTDCRRVTRPMGVVCRIAYADVLPTHWFIPLIRLIASLILEGAPVLCRYILPPFCFMIGAGWVWTCDPPERLLGVAMRPNQNGVPPTANPTVTTHSDFSRRQFQLRFEAGIAFAFQLLAIFMCRPVFEWYFFRLPDKTRQWTLFWFIPFANQCRKHWRAQTEPRNTFSRALHTVVRVLRAHLMFWVLTLGVTILTRAYWLHRHWTDFGFANTDWSPLHLWSLPAVVLNCVYLTWLVAFGYVFHA